MTTSYPLHKIKVALFEGIHTRAAEMLSDEGYTVERFDTAPDAESLIRHAADAHIIGVRSKTKVTREFLEATSHLWAIGCFCIGTDQVDLDCADEIGAAVFNSPFSNTRSVAEMTIAEIIGLHRGLFDCSSRLHAGTWRKSAAGCYEVRGRTLGIVGYGHIGSQVSILAEAMGMRVIFFDIAHKLPLGNAAPAASLDDLLAASDVVTLHVPDTPQTKGLMSAARIRAMRNGSYLINNARGDVVDLDALAAALDEGHLAGAAVDVFPAEPSGASDSFKTPLAGSPNTVLTPHIGGSTEEAQQNIAQDVAMKLARFMNNGSTVGSVNLPEVDLPHLGEGRHRILHYHRNVPGVLGRLHTMIADLGVNIFAEHLQSNPGYGYVILDVDNAQGEAIKNGLQSIPETIRVRALW